MRHCLGYSFVTDHARDRWGYANTRTDDVIVSVRPGFSRAQIVAALRKLARKIERIPEPAAGSAQGEADGRGLVRRGHRRPIAAVG